MFVYNPSDILIENAKTFAERREIFALTESEQLKINNELIAKLFNSALKKSHVDFEDIPKSKGDVTKYVGYKYMIDAIEQLRQISYNNNVKIKEVEVVSKALSNIVAYRYIFEPGYKLGKEFVILQYNTLVAACVMGVSSIIASYVDYVKRIDVVEFKIINSRISAGKICIDSLEEFNKSIAKGEFSKIMNNALRSGVNEAALTEVGAVATGFLIAAGVVGGIPLLVSLIRYIIFYFNFKKQKISEMLDQQATFFELNKNNLMANSSGVSPEERDKIMMKQDGLIVKLRNISDKLKIDDNVASSKAEAEMKKENSKWTLSDVKSDATGNGNNGFQLV